LEDLGLKGCRCTFHEISSHSLKNKNCEFSKLSAITSPALKSLVIESYSCEGLYSQLVIITAPAVAYLLLYVEAWHFKGGVSLEEMPCLVKASIRLMSNNVESKLRQDRLNLLCGVSNVTSLVLSGFETMVCLLCLH
jgi:hypothetical protein